MNINQKDLASLIETIEQALSWEPVTVVLDNVRIKREIKKKNAKDKKK